MRIFAFMSVVNSLAAWALMFGLVFKNADVPTACLFALITFVLAIFAIDRGFKHLDIKAGKEGIDAHFDGGDQALTVQTTTTVAATPNADAETKS